MSYEVKTTCINVLVSLFVNASVQFLKADK